MPTLSTTVEQFAAYLAAGRQLVDADDVRQDALLAIFDSEDLPLAVRKWVRRAVRRSFWRLEKRASRHKKRCRTSSEFQHVPEPQRNPIAERQAMLHEAINELPADAFEREALLAMCRQHPLYSTPAEFVKAQRRYSRSHAYRTIARLRDRLRQYVDATSLDYRRKQKRTVSPK